MGAHVLDSWNSMEPRGSAWILARLWADMGSHRGPMAKDMRGHGNP